MRESISLKILARSQNKWGSSCCCVTSRSKGSAALGNVLERPGPSSWSRRLLHQSIYVAAALLLWEDKEVNTRSLLQWQHLGTKAINRQHQEADHPELNWVLLSLPAVRDQCALKLLRALGHHSSSSLRAGPYHLFIFFLFISFLDGPLACLLSFLIFPSTDLAQWCTHDTYNKYFLYIVPNFFSKWLRVAYWNRKSINKQV